MRNPAPVATLFPSPHEGHWACNGGPDTPLNTLEKLYLCLRDMRPEITLDPKLQTAARIPLERMLELSR